MLKGANDVESRLENISPSKFRRRGDGTAEDSEVVMKPNRNSAFIYSDLTTGL